MNATDIAAEHLEDLLNDAEIYLDEDILSEDCKCECQHTAEGNQMCSVKVTHINTFACSPDRFLICFAAARFYVLSFGTGDYCEDCLRPTSDCWSIRPV